jgi:hypothetical protein
MANYFVDSTTGDDGDDGTTMDLAWATIEYALESGGLSAGDVVWVRRVHSEIPTSNIVIAYGGDPGNPIKLIGWPRNSDSSISSATWTNGSTTVDLIVGLSMDKEKHVGRFITAPDGHDYLITYITDSNTILIDREYASSTVSGASGAATIKADEDYALAQAIDDSGWTIQKSDYNSDADDLALIDFNSTAYGFNPNSDRNWYFANLEIKNSNWQYGCVGYGGVCDQHWWRGCLFHTTSDTFVIWAAGNGLKFFERCIIHGSGAGTSQRGIYVNTNLYLKDVAIYNLGDHGLGLANADGVILRNVNMGVEQSNGDHSILSTGGCPNVTLFDCKFDGGQAVMKYNYPDTLNKTGSENHNKVLGAHVTYNAQGTLTKVDVSAGAGDPEKRTGGADSVIEILYDESTLGWCIKTPHALPCEVFSHEFEATTDSKSYRYYVQAEGAVTATELWIEVEYVSAHDDTSEYVVKRVISDEAITARADAADWDNYIEVTDIEPAVASKVRIRCYCSYYHATNKIYIDPKVVITDA